MTKGYIYCLSNKSFKKNIYKIGYTSKKPNIRAEQLYKTGLPTPFKVEISKYVNDIVKAERQLHEKFDKMRINEDREFFKVSLECIKKSFRQTKGLKRRKIFKKVVNNPRNYILRKRTLSRKCKHNVYADKKK